jgi:hypothetical protein
LSDFDTYEEDIDTELFLDDYIRCFMSLSMTNEASDKVWKKTSEVMIKNMDSLNDHSMENLIYSLARSRRDDKQLWHTIAQFVVQKNLLKEDRINEFCLLLGIVDDKVRITQ